MRMWLVQIPDPSLLQRISLPGATCLADPPVSRPGRPKTRLTTGTAVLARETNRLLRPMPLRDLLDEHLSDIPNASAAVYNHSQRHACLSRVAVSGYPRLRSYGRKFRTGELRKSIDLRSFIGSWLKSAPSPTLLFGPRGLIGNGFKSNDCLLVENVDIVLPARQCRWQFASAD